MAERPPSERGPLPSYGRFEAPVTRVDDDIEKRIAAMKQPEGLPSEKWPDDSTDVTGTAQKNAMVARSTTAEMAPPALPPTLKEALVQRVKFAGGELPLWSVIVPAFVMGLVLVALVAGAATARDVIVEAPVASAAASADASASAPAPVVSAPPLQTAATPHEVATADTSPTPAPATKKPVTLIDRAAAGEAEALKTLESKPEGELTVDEALAVATGNTERELAAARALREKLAQDPTLVKNSSVLAELYKYTQNPLTAREALAAIAGVPGATSADMLYEVWTGTPTKTVATDLARALLLGKTMRAKASPALAIALDLRTTEKCEDVLALLPRASKDADKRSFVALSKMQRKTGCGPAKRQDCYPCLRKGTDLKDAMAASKLKREPSVFGK